MGRTGKNKRRKSKKSREAEKRVDQTLHLTGRRRGAILKEEVRCQGEIVVKYSLAYINPHVCSLDNGRVLGYDNEHAAITGITWATLKRLIFLAMKRS